jgi:hypothetical protein
VAEYWPSSPGKHQEGDGDGQVVKRPDPEHAPNPEGAQVNLTEGSLLAEQERRDQKTAQNEEELHAHPAVLAKGARSFTADQLAENRRRHALMKEEHERERDETQAVELREVDPAPRFVGTGRNRRS